MHKLAQLNKVLERSPFRAIHSKESGEYKFYDTRTWKHTQSPPEWDEVTGTTIFGFNKSCYFARGIVLGYAQNLVLRTPTSSVYNSRCVECEFRKKKG